MNGVRVGGENEEDVVVVVVGAVRASVLRQGRLCAPWMPAAPHSAPFFR